jgi:2-dehydropantoate 2-reductase
MIEESIKPADLSFLVVGAGAIGGITAAMMRKAGYNVEIVCKYEDYATEISGKGLKVKGSSGEFTVSMPAWSGTNLVKDKKDIILLATKATDLPESAKAVLPLMKENSMVVSLQNGFCEDYIGSVVGRERVIGCVVGWGATMELHGNLCMTSSGDFIIGYPDRSPDDFLKSLAGIMSSVVPCTITDNINGHLYSKLVINSCITSLGAICGLYLGKMLSLKKIRNIFIEIISEAMRVAEKMNFKVEVFGGKLDFEKFLKGSGPLANLRRNIVLRIIGYKYRRLKSSGLQSLERGKPTEIDFFNGYIVNNAKALGINVPVNIAIVKIIHEIEEGKRKIGIDNFNDPVFKSFK